MTDASERKRRRRADACRGGGAAVARNDIRRGPRSRFPTEKEKKGSNVSAKKIPGGREGGRRTVMEKGRENTKTTFFSLSFSFPGNLALRLPFPFRLLFLPLPPEDEEEGGGAFFSGLAPCIN